MELVLRKDKETKNTWRYTELPDTDTLVIGSIYIQKSQVIELGSPEEIKITIEAL